MINYEKAKRAMEQTEKINKLLEDTQNIINQYEQERKKQGADFNVFEVLDVKEVLTCRMLHALLDYNVPDGNSRLFLKLFLEKVLDQVGFYDEEINNARVTVEELLPNARRIDLYICVGKRVFPIEVKLHAKDQNCQCYDYYQYAQKRDPKALIYYLTLDRHMPSDESRNGLNKDKELKLISFEEEIMEWLKICLKQVQQCAVIKIIIEQFMDNINRLTGNGGEKLAMEIITDFETFKTADVIAKSVQTVKTKMMKDIFEEIEKNVKEECYLDYKGKVEKYYKQSASTYPSLNYYLNEEKSLVMRIEIDWNLYFGICQWDKENNCVSQKLESNKKEVDTRVGKYLKQESDSFYRWEYLPVSSERRINFHDFSGSYSELFDEEKRKNIVNEICGTVKNVLNAWKNKEKD